MPPTLRIREAMASWRAPRALVGQKLAHASPACAVGDDRGPARGKMVALRTVETSLGCPTL